MAEKEKKEKTLFQDMGDTFKEFTDFLPSPPPFPPIPWGVTKEVIGEGKGKKPPLPPLFEK